MNIPELDTQSYYGAAGAPPINWRDHVDEEADDEDSDGPSMIELEGQDEESAQPEDVSERN